jgi:hypothetical protein
MSERLLDSHEKLLVQQGEIDGIKDKLLDVSNDFYGDRNFIKNSLTTFKEQEHKINDIVAKTKDIMTFVNSFRQFEERIDKSLGELFKKDMSMGNDFTSRLNLLDDL